MLYFVSKEQGSGLSTENIVDFLFEVCDLQRVGKDPAFIDLIYKIRNGSHNWSPQLNIKNEGIS